MSKAARFQRLTGGSGPNVTLKVTSVRGGAWTMAAEGADFVLRFVSIAVLARLLVPEYFGIVGMVTAITAVADRFKDLGLSIATVQRDEVTHEQVSTLFWVNAGLGFLTAVLVAGLAFPIASFYGDSRLVLVTLSIAATFLWDGLAIQHLALLRRTMRFSRIAAIQVGASVGSIAVAILLATQGWGYWALVAREVSRSVFATVATWACCPWVPGRPSRQTGVKAMVKFGTHMTAVQLAYILSANFGQILIGRSFGAVALGIYRQASQLASAPLNQLTNPIFTVSESALSRLQHDAAKYRRFFRKLVTLLSLCTMPPLVLLLVYSDDLVLLMLGRKWIEAAPILRILVIGSFLSPVATAASAVMVTCGYSRRFVALGLMNAAGLMIFSLAGLPWGVRGVAFASIWALYLLLIPRLNFGFKDTPVSTRLFFEAVARPMAASLVMGVALIVLRDASLASSLLGNLGLGASVGAVVYFGAWAFMPGGAAELKGLGADLFEAWNVGRPLSGRHEGTDAAVL
jgi:O-antigen/teichoic acid export membrane protein